jgi:hypothetical protein
MALLAKKKTKSSVPPLDADTYPAVCIGVVDLGEQHSEMYKNYQNKVMFLFEICGETVDVDGEAKPRWLSKEFTLSLSEKSNLAKTIASWTGVELTEDIYDVTQLIGKPAMVVVTVKETDNGTFNDITVIASPPKKMQMPEAESETICFEIENWDDEVFAKLPEWIQNKIKKSTEYQTRLAPDEKIGFKDDNKSGESDGESGKSVKKDDKAPF